QGGQKLRNPRNCLIGLRRGRLSARFPRGCPQLLCITDFRLVESLCQQSLGEKCCRFIQKLSAKWGVDWLGVSQPRDEFC
ncbi:MAG: hypothetical protein ACLFRM_08595, partial [Guyparkeria sp.]|uniref:hypothetical protein n=1 Tax=Guyparkeria sp. TaxID=2035736 RepID=UPI003979176E